MDSIDTTGTNVSDNTNEKKIGEIYFINKTFRILCNCDQKFKNVKVFIMHFIGNHLNLNNQSIMSLEEIMINTSNKTNKIEDQLKHNHDKNISNEVNLSLTITNEENCVGSDNFRNVRKDLILNESNSETFNIINIEHNYGKMNYEEINLNDARDDCINVDDNDCFIFIDNKKSSEETKKSQPNDELNTKKKTWDCSICQKSFARQLNMVKHKMITHKLFLNTIDEVNKDTNSTEQIWSKGKWNCSICKQSFTRRSSLIKHRVTKHNMDAELVIEIRCRWCGEHFKTLNGCANHENKIHNANGPIIKHQCKWCSRTFTRRAFCLRHEEEKHDSNGKKINGRKWKKRLKKHICETCGNMFAHPWKLIEHMRSHTGERPLKCDLCSKTFARKQLLRSHKKYHLDEKPYKCDYCNKGFFEKRKLSLHEMLHTGTYKVKCNICDKQFRSGSMLNMHKKIHTYINKN